MRMIPDGIMKIGAIQMISDEALFRDMGYRNPEFQRKANVTEIPPSAAVWARYYTALVAVQALQAYEFTKWGGPDYDTEVREPEPTLEFEYLETHEEWLARCREIVKGWN